MPGTNEYQMKALMPFVGEKIYLLLQLVGSYENDKQLDHLLTGGVVGGLLS